MSLNSNIVDIVPLARFADVNITSIKDTLVNSWHVISDLVTGDLATYKSELVSVRTAVEVEVPLGGKLEITNNPQYSAACALYNSIDFVVETVFLFSDFATNMPEGLRATYNDHVATEVFAAFRDGPLNENGGKNFKLMAKKMTEEFGKLSVKEITKKGAVTSIQAFVDTTKSIMAELDIDLASIMLKSAGDMGIAVSESLLTEAMGPAGLSLTAMFEFAKCMNYLSFFVSLSGSFDQHAFVIQFNGQNGALCDNGVYITTSEGEQGRVQNTFFVAKILHAADLNDLMKESFEQVTGTTKYTVTETALQNDGEEIDMAEAATMRMPVPAGYDPARCTVYEIEADGSFSPVEATRDGMHYVFTVDRMGQYVIVEEPMAGDTDGDNTVTNADVLAIFRYLYNAGENPMAVPAAADVDGDGAVTNADVLLIFQHLYNATLYPLD